MEDFQFDPIKRFLGAFIKEEQKKVKRRSKLPSFVRSVLTKLKKKRK
jgi:hypothetical protein